MSKAMLRATIFSLALLLVTATPPVSVAGEFGNKDEAVAMVKRVQEKLKNDGPESTFAAVTNREREFHDRDLYPFIYLRIPVKADSDSGRSRTAFR